MHTRPWQAEETFSNGYTETGGVGETLTTTSVATVLPQLLWCWCFVVS